MVCKKILAYIPFISFFFPLSLKNVEKLEDQEKLNGASNENIVSIENLGIDMVLVVVLIKISSFY
jgi:hypothetical protein